MDLSLIAFLAIAIIFVLIISNLKQHKPKKHKSSSDFLAKQKERVSAGGYVVKPLLNRTEQIARKAIYNVLFEAKKQKQYFLFSQVSIGEFLTHQNRQLYRDINTKRVDFLLCDNEFNPKIIIEIHGQGHYKNNAEKRDAIKREAVESAGLLYIPIAVGNDEEKIKQAVTNKLQGML